MCQHGSETLVIVLDGDVGTLLAPAVNELLDTSQVLAGLTVGLSGLADDDALHLLALGVSLEVIEKLRSGNSRQPSGYELQRVGDCQSCTLLTVVNGKNTCHSLVVAYFA